MWCAWETHHCCSLFSSPWCTTESSSRHWVVLPSGQRAEGLPCPVHSLASASGCCSPGFTESVAFPLLIVEFCYPRITVIQKARHTGLRKGRKCGIGEGDISSLTAHTLCKPKNFLKTLCHRDISTKLLAKWISSNSWSEKESLAGISFTPERVLRLSFQWSLS